MSITIIGIIITAVAIKLDQFTHYQYNGLVLVALAGTMTVIASLVL
jgi:hypothetical protein